MTARIKPSTESKVKEIQRHPSMKDERELMARCGKETPFKVPEGYFEHFHEQLMSNLPETVPTAAPAERITFMTRIKPWLYMAAMFSGIVFMVQSLMYVQQTRLTDSSLAEEIYTEEEVDHFMSSSLYNEYVLYSYLTTTDYN